MGAAAVKAGLSLGLGMVVSGAASTGGNQLGKFINSAANGQSYQANPLDIAKDFLVGAATFGVGNKLGINSNAQQMAENRVYGSISEYLGSKGEMDVYSTFPAAFSSPFVTGVVDSTRQMIEVGQVAYSVGTQIGGSLIDAYT